MASDPIEIVAYRPAWPRAFDAERETLLTALAGHPIDAIEHIGSTAVPGLASKPIIDILIAVPSLKAARAIFPERLAALGYAFWAENPASDRLFFVKGLPPDGEGAPCGDDVPLGEGRTHHVHVCEPGAVFDRHILFRTYLRAHPTEAAAYAVLKRQLAESHRDDREAYTAAKAAFIERVLTLARAT